jgi:prevent-host-death family protein
VRTVTIAELKDKLSAYLKLVQAGEEVIVRNRNTPVARLLPARAGAESAKADMLARGLIKLPSKPLDMKAFLAIGKGVRTEAGLLQAMADALQQDREEEDYASLLGHQRVDASVHTGPKIRRGKGPVAQRGNRVLVGNLDRRKKHA